MRAQPIRRPGIVPPVVRGLALFYVAAAAAAVAGCGPKTAVEHGRDLAADRGFSHAPSNPFSCATCHAAVAAVDPAHRFAGSTLFDVTGRPTWWAGRFDALLDAVNYCYVEFMRAPAPLAPDDADGRALLAWLESISPAASSPARPVTVVATLDATYYASLRGGDPGRGQALFAATCAPCHGSIHTGAGRLSTVVSVIPDESIRAHGTDPLTGAFPITVEKVRHGKFFGAAGNMPFYSLEALSDQELADLLAYLGV